MRVIAGAWRGRRLITPPGGQTRPTADRVRQALFDMLLHAPWAGRTAVEGARVLDAFAGTGALGLEALSRGAAHATFIEREPAALAALRANIAACGAGERARVIACDALAPPRAPAACGLVFLDPPYERGAEGILVAPALTALYQAGWIAPNALIAVETARGARDPVGIEALAARTHGAARITIGRLA
ncbi:MAG TPA: 16S rRNA (guanine(966)-N(2))-methyltransferase RsmD [Acetobacteraceae bacterium]|nr:16S rRNA (guanine(966)-N(2))-methyltransferase RsmD [Acetobacteraceae bacterium]